MTRTVVLLAALGAATTLHAQATPGASKPAPAAASAPAGWMARYDRPVADPGASRLAAAGSALHFGKGPSGTWYRAEPVDGLYRVQATFEQTSAPMHPEAYGLMVFGRQMETPTQNYVYFMVRGDGKWALKHRANDTDVHTIMDFTPHAAIVTQDAAGKATNTVAIDVAADSVRFIVNDQVVHAMPRTYLKDVSGAPGIRMNHGLDVNVTGFAVTKKS